MRRAFSPSGELRDVTVALGRRYRGIGPTLLCETRAAVWLRCSCVRLRHSSFGTPPA